MTLLDRTRTCRTPGCKRAPAHPDQTFCEAHRLPWKPAWLANLRAKELA